MLSTAASMNYVECDLNEGETLREWRRAREIERRAGRPSGWLRRLLAA
jgi:hypothetical protein